MRAGIPALRQHLRQVHSTPEDNWREGMDRPEMQWAAHIADYGPVHQGLVWAELIAIPELYYLT